jgi:phage terminase large subunit-like protein
MLTEPCKEFERRILAGTLAHSGNPALRWMVGNLAVRRDPNDNIAPDKRASFDRIDGPQAIITGLCCVQAARAEAAKKPPTQADDYVRVLR